MTEIDLLQEVRLLRSQSSAIRERLEGLIRSLAITRAEEDPLAARMLPSVTPQCEDLPTFATILDEFSQECFAPDLDLIQIGRANWRSQLSGTDVDALLVESAWLGNGGDWQYCISQPDRLGNPLRDVLAYCRERNIPSLFWNKEDPAHFERFAETAKLFDYILTTDSGCLDGYRTLSGKNNAFVLPFAAQPALHNPVRLGPLRERVAFTGSWRGLKYPRRAEWLDTLLTPVLERNVLDIFDRFSGTTEDADLVFPKKFQSAIRGTVPYTELVSSVYKNYLAIISVNSVENSDTMLARRVFELLACGSPVISSYSRATERFFSDIVIMPRTSKEVGDTFDRLKADSLYRASLAAKGVRLVHSQHTYRNRLEQIADVIGVPYVLRRPKKVALVCSSKRPTFLKQAAANLTGQTYQEREVVFIAHNSEYSEDDIVEAFRDEPKFRFLRGTADNVLADNLNMALDLVDCNYFAKMDDDDFYAPYYVADAMLCFEYAPQVGVAGKNTYFTYVQSLHKTVCRFPNRYYRFTNHVAGATLIIDRERTDGIRFQKVARGTDSLFIKECQERDVRLFSTDPFNYLHVRYAEPGQHTWNISDQEFVSKTTLVGDGKLTERIFL